MVADVAWRRIGVGEVEQVEDRAGVAAIPPLVVIESDDNAVVWLEVVGDVIRGLPGAVPEDFVTGSLGEFE